MLEVSYAPLDQAIGSGGLTAEALTYLGWLKLREGAAPSRCRSCERHIKKSWSSPAPITR